MATYRALSDAQVESESKCGYKPLTIESGITVLPFSELGDREFELLTYLLLKKEIQAGEHFQFTDISLMQAVGERGRDCVLYSSQSVAGVVQCKKYTGRFSRPLLLKELIKFLLFAQLDQSILPDPDNFEYKLYVSNDLTEPAIALIYSYQAELKKEIGDGSISKYVVDVVAEYESFAAYRDKPPVADVLALLQRIRVSSSNATDLTNRVHRYQDILTSFFRVQTVISLEGADTLIRTAFEDYGLRLVTDEDLKELQTRIGSVGEENRINLGFVDFFGYSRDFFRFLQGAKFQQVMSSAAGLMGLLDKELLNFLVSEIHRRVYEKITIELLNKKLIHPFSAGLPPPYLLDRLTPAVVAGTLPKDLLNKYYPQCSMSKEEVIAKVSERLFDASSRVMDGDYSHLVGNPDDIAFKLRIYAHMHQGLGSIDDAKTVLSSDLKVMMPVLDEIETEIVKVIASRRTIVIKDAGFFEDDGQLKRMLCTIQSIEQGITRSSSGHQTTPGKHGGMS